MRQYKVAIIGAGVIGLAAAAVLAETVGDVLVIDRHEGFGRESSSRSGGVVHSGIFHPTGSLKSALCIDGASMLYKYAAGKGVPFRLTGKLVLATQETDLQELEELYRHASRSGIAGVEYLDGRQVSISEPGVDCIAAILIPAAGVIDAPQLMKAFYDEAASKAEFVFGHKLDAIERGPEGYTIVSGAYRASAKVLINAAGTEAEAIARLAGISDDFGIEYLKGSYFKYSKGLHIQRILAPVSASGLGVAPDSTGKLNIGPLEEAASEAAGLAVDMSMRDEFIRRIPHLAGVEDEHMVPASAGISPRMKSGDFYIAHESDRGLPGFINLLGIDTPGLTCALSIAREVNAIAREALG